MTGKPNKQVHQSSADWVILSNPGAMGKSGAGQFFPLALFFLIFGLGACFG